MKRFLYLVSLLILLLIFIPIEIFAQTPPPMPYKIGGTITIDNTDMTQATFTGYSIEVTKNGNVALDPVAEATSLLSSNAYTIDIPVYDENQTGGATPGETLEIHVYEGSTELTVDTPYNANIAMGESGENDYTINIYAYTSKTLTINDPDHGSITASPSSDDNTYLYGTTVTLTAEPDIYYVFDSWTGDVTSASATTTIIMDDDQTVTASFSQCTYTLTMAVNDVQAGSVTPGTGDMACGSDVIITATAADGYYFTGWTGDVVNPNLATTTVTMDGDQTVTANFTATTYTLTAQSPSNGTISLNPPSTGNVYGEDSVVTVTATPASHYLFSGWTGDLTGSVSPTTITMNEDKTIGATFIECTNTLSMAVNDPQMGSTSPVAGVSDQTCNGTVAITAIPASGYHFVNWTGDTVSNATSAATTITMDDDKSVTANFVSTSYTLTMGTSNNGTTNPVSGDHEYGEGAVVTITATPGSGYVFSSWTGDVASRSSATTTVTMDTDQTITPNFTAASNDDDTDGGGGGGGGGIFGEISIRDVLGYHYDGSRSDGTGVYMPVTSAYKALKGAQTHVEGFSPGIASFVRSGFEFLEQKAENDKDGLLYRVGTISFPVFGKIAEYYLDMVGAERLKAEAYSNTTISIDEFKNLEQQGKAVAPHRVTFEEEQKQASVHE